MSDLSKLSNAELVSVFDEIILVLPPFNKRARAILREAASRLQAPAVAEVETLNCRDDTGPCPHCGCEDVHMVRVIPLVAGGDRGEAVSCGDADCGFRGPVAADMHSAVSAWNDAAALRTGGSE